MRHAPPTEQYCEFTRFLRDRSERGYAVAALKAPCAKPGLYGTGVALSEVGRSYEIISERFQLSTIQDSRGSRNPQGSECSDGIGAARRWHLFRLDSQDRVLLIAPLCARSSAG